MINGPIKQCITYAPHFSHCACIRFKSTITTNTRSVIILCWILSGSTKWNHTRSRIQSNAPQYIGSYNGNWIEFWPNQTVWVSDQVAPLVEKRATIISHGEMFNFSWLFCILMSKISNTRDLSVAGKCLVYFLITLSTWLTLIYAPSVIEIATRLLHAMYVCVMWIGGNAHCKVMCLFHQWFEIQEPLSVVQDCWVWPWVGHEHG